MIRRRIFWSVALKWAGLLSPWRGRHAHARRPAVFPLDKRVGGEAGGTSPPFEPSDGGGRVPPEGTSGSGLLARPPERAVGGGDECRRHPPSGKAISLSPEGPRRSATNRRS